MHNKVLVTTAVAVLILLSGALVSLNTDKIYRYDVEFGQDAREVSFDFVTNTESEAKAVMVSNSGQFDVRTVIALYDESYAVMTDRYILAEMLEDLGVLFDIMSGITFDVRDSNGILDAMDVSAPSETAFFLATGSIPDILYDGTADSPLAVWLQNGGVLVNVSGCLGKYISHGPEQEDIEQVSGYGRLFAGVDDEAFLDLDKRGFAEYRCNEAIRDSFDFYMNEYTYGLDYAVFSDFLDLGYTTMAGESCAAVYRSGNGMVFNFGSSIINHVHFDYHMVKIIASGIDYTSEVLDTFSGKGQCGGSFAVPEGSFSVYASMGSPRTLYGETYRS